jgi:hypothetical protein
MRSLLCPAPLVVKTRVKPGQKHGVGEDPPRFRFAFEVTEK